MVYNIVEPQYLKHWYLKASIRGIFFRSLVFCDTEVPLYLNNKINMLYNTLYILDI